MLTLQPTKPVWLIVLLARLLFTQNPIKCLENMSSSMSFKVENYMTKFGLLLIVTNLATVATTTIHNVIPQDCPQKCGDVSIPYPFGIEKHCALNKDFLITCNNTYNPPKALLHPGSRNPIIEISLEGYLRKYTYVARDCYSKTGEPGDYSEFWSRVGNFYFSPSRNKFTAVGCNAVALLSGTSNGMEYGSGCISVCYNESSVVNGSCNGVGCCQISVPKQLSELNVTLESFWNRTQDREWSFNPCSYAFVSDDYVFSTSHLHHFPSKLPMALDWAIGKHGCKEATKNLSSYACKEHSECRDSDNGPGYRCFCSSGYQGNPYLPGGCVDINECAHPNSNDCSHKCNNIEGSYTCSCPKGLHGDGRKHGQGCKLLDKHRIILIIIGDTIFLILLLVGSWLFFCYRRRRRQKKLKENFFKQNGGLILLDKISRRQAGSLNSIKIFKSKELKEATDNFSEGRICGRGGFGTVYKGNLSDGSVVAIKKSKIADQSQVEQFINEITILSQINHRNVVRFLGCCLETPVPLLVYEFITNGTLSDHIHDDGKKNPRMPWQTRLKIAAETAGVLAYLHSAHSTPIIHRDIKPTNILLDENFTSKISDFGASRLIPKNEDEMCTMVQGTLGYLDPEYLQTSQLTEKSDVYSFGVVLVELLTGLKAVSFERSEEDRSLVKYFLTLNKEDDILESLDKGMVIKDNIKEIIEVAKIAKMCLKVRGEERPTMKEVAMELEGLVMDLKHKWATSGSKVEENECLLIQRSFGDGNSFQMGENSSIREISCR